MSGLEEELRRLRDHVAQDVRISPTAAHEVLRRAKRSRAINATLAVVLASAVVVAAFATAGAITSSSGGSSGRLTPSSDGATGDAEIGLGNKEVTFSFLLEGDCYSLVLPEDFEELPELSSPVSARSFDFVRPEHDNPVEPIDTVEGRDGREVEIGVLTEDPPQWSLRWELPAGALYTHVRGADGGRARAEVVASSISIRDSACGPGPEIDVHPPLQPSTASPPYQESASFTSLERKQWVVTIERPSRLSPAKTVVGEGDFGGFFAEKGTDAGLLVSVFVTTNEDDVRELVEMVADSLKES